MIPRLESLLRPGDEVIFTADHGCDPTAPGTDHTREYVPFVHLGPRRRRVSATSRASTRSARAVQGAFGL